MEVIGMGPGEAYLVGMIVLASLLATRLGPMGDALGAALARLGIGERARPD